MTLFNWTARESDSGETKPLCVRTGGLEDPGVTVAVASCERLHHPVNLLSFSRETEAPQKLPARRRRCKKNTHAVSSRKEGGGGFSTSSETHKKNNKAKGKNCCNVSHLLASESILVTRTSAPAPDSDLRTRAGPRRLSVSADASPPCERTITQISTFKMFTS